MAIEAHAQATPSPVPVARIVEALANAGLIVTQSDSLPAQVEGITDDSRSVTAGSLFIAVRGHAQDGHEWLAQAAASGAACAIVEDASRTTLPAIVVRDGRRAAAVAAAAFYGWPAHAVRLLGVTGTNGKTTTVGLIRHLLHRDGAPAASIGTLGVLVGSEGIPFPGGGGLTTPGPVELQRVLRALVEQGVQTVTMEVSSHSLDQRRVDGLSFAAAVFTNLTRDHLDYHGTMEAYLRAKSRLVGLLAKDGVAIANADDPAWRELPAANNTLSYGIAVGADVSARDIVYSAQGSQFLLVTNSGAAAVSLPLIGEFNVSNALAAAAAALAVGVPLADIATGLSRAPQVPGRLEKLRTRPTVLRDYSHTPDSLERAIVAVRPFANASTSVGEIAGGTVDAIVSASGNESGSVSGGDGAGRLIVVFGCGGDRDRGKRPVMGEIAERLADYVILTSDNPRTEDPERILDDIEAGMTRQNHVRIEDRRLAIAHAFGMASPNDVILLAGKGHETYQIRGTVSFPFDEKIVVDELSVLP